MKLIVFGATGTIGRHVVDRALAQGHEVTAFARAPGALDSTDPKLTRAAGDVLDRDAVADAVRGHDAAIVALGAGRRGKVRTAGTRNVIDAMARHGPIVSRAAWIGAEGSGSIEIELRDRGNEDRITTQILAQVEGS